MRKKIVVFFVLVSALFAETPHYLLGLRNSKYAMVGLKYGNYGLAVENSLFVQSVNLQYARMSLFYEFELPMNFFGYYALYFGMRYNHDFFDVGCVANLKWKPFDRYLQVSGIFQPFYDSDLNRRIGYSVEVQTIPLDEIGLFVGLENLPDFREIENRLAVGLIFLVPHMLIKPEISTPLDFNFDYTRFSVSFVYENLF